MECMCNRLEKILALRLRRLKGQICQPPGKLKLKVSRLNNLGLDPALSDREKNPLTFNYIRERQECDEKFTRGREKSKVHFAEKNNFRRAMQENTGMLVALLAGV